MAFVDTKIEAGQYGTASEYVSELIQHDRERIETSADMEITALIRFLVAASDAILFQSSYYDSVSDSGLSSRWERAVDQALAALLLTSQGGAPFGFDHPSLAGLRR